MVLFGGVTKMSLLACGTVNESLTSCDGISK